MATKNLLDTIRKNTTEAVTAARPKADEDRKAHAPADATSAPAKPSDDAALTAFRQQATTNLTKVPAKGTLDTTEPVDPSGYRVQATTRMPGETHKATTYKMDLRMIGMLDALSRKQNIAALISHLVARGLADVLREQAGKSTTSYHESYDSGDRNAFCGVTEPLLLAMVAFVEQNKHE